MKVSKREDFGLLFMSYLARNHSGQFIPLSEISSKLSLSSLFMKHIALKLKKTGLVESKEGVDGGYRLTKRPDKISISEILNSISPKILNIPCETSDCRVKKSISDCNCSHLWKLVNKNLRDQLEKISLKDFISL